MKKNVILLLVFVAAITVFLVAITFNFSNSDDDSSVIDGKNFNVEKVECYKDIDCLSGGCSGQLCLPRDQASSTITTCEWKDEYECYAQDGCICQNNTCQWAGNELFTECMNNL